MHPAADPAERFSGRTRDYARYRPDYPSALVPLLQAELGLSPSWVVADIGSGTGLSARPFLELGCTVLAVEPNAEMRAAARESLRRYGSRLRVVAGRAEATNLQPTSIDLVVAGQAFHWFDVSGARREFSRILRPPGRVALIWNTRLLEGSPFLREYEKLLLQFGTDYGKVRHDTRRRERLEPFFETGFTHRVLPNAQALDLEGLRGRLISSSYTPAESDPARRAMLSAADELFRRREERGRVCLEYTTEIYLGSLGVIADR